MLLQSMATERHFFQEAPALSWFQWLGRRIYAPEKIQPTEIQPRTEFPGPPLRVHGLLPNPAKPESAQEYSLFLQTLFYPQSSGIQLRIPPTYLEYCLRSKTIIGVEVRDTRKTLIGCVFDIYAGDFQQTPTGLVTWLCVVPQWRSKGVASAMLFSLYKYSEPRRIHWWRNDGWMRSPIPPVWNEPRIVRKKQFKRTILHGQRQVLLKRAPLQKWQQTGIQQWKAENPDGIVLSGSSAGSCMEVWECQLTPTLTAALYIQPTFEVKQTTQELYCECITWVWHPNPPAQYEQAHFLESMIDQLPYEYIEAPATMPHLEGAWQPSVQTCWSAIGLDTGTPVLRTILPLCSA